MTLPSLDFWDGILLFGVMKGVLSLKSYPRGEDWIVERALILEALLERKDRDSVCWFGVRWVGTCN